MRITSHLGVVTLADSNVMVIRHRLVREGAEKMRIFNCGRIGSLGATDGLRGGRARFDSTALFRAGFESRTESLETSVNSL